MTTEQSHVHPLESEARRGSTHEKLQEELSQLNLNEESSGSDDEISSGMSRVAKEEASTPLDDGASEQDRLRQEIARLKDENKRLIKMVQERDHWQAKAREYKKKCHILKAIVKKTQAEIEQWDGATTDMQEVNNKDQQPEGPSPDFKTVRAEEPQTDRDLRRSQFYASVKPKVIHIPNPTTLSAPTQKPTDLGISGMGEWRGPLQPSPLKKASGRSRNRSPSPTKTGPKIERSSSPTKRPTLSQPPRLWKA